MMTRTRILVVDDELRFLEKVKQNIKKFDVVTASTIPEAIQMIVNDGISLIVADIKLKGKSRGFKIFSELFCRGESIPGILITGYSLTEADKKYFTLLGAIKILEKGGGQGTLSERVEREAVNILDDKDSPFVSAERRIKQDGLENKNMTYNKKTKKISDWLGVVKKPATTPEEKIAIVKNIAKVCNKHSQHNDGTDYVFPRF